MNNYKPFIAFLLLAATAAESQAQFSFLFGEMEQQPVVYQEAVQANAACGMQGCPPKRTTWGHYRVSWRKWPEDISQYSTAPQLSPFVIPDRSGAPEAEVPDPRDEMLFVPRHGDKATGTKTGESSDTGSTSDDKPSTTDDLPTPDVDLDSADPAADILRSDDSALPDNEADSDLDIFGSPDESSATPGTESPLDTTPQPNAESEDSTDSFLDDLDLGPDSNDSDGSGLDDLLNGDDSDDGFGTTAPRRYNRRNARNAAPNRFSDFRRMDDPNRAAVAKDVEARLANQESDALNPLRRRMMEDAPHHVATLQEPPSRRSPAPLQEPPQLVQRSMDNAYDARQIDYQEYESRQHLYNYPNDSRFAPEPRSQYRGRGETRYDDRRFYDMERPYPYAQRRPVRQRPLYRELPGGFDRRAEMYSPPTDRVPFTESQSQPEFQKPKNPLRR